MGKSTQGKSLTAGQLIAIGIFLMIFWVFIIPALQQNLGIVGGGGQTTTTVGNLVDVTKPVKFAVIDSYAGSGVSSAAVTVYKGSVISESLSSGSDGTVQTALTYRSGEQLNVKVVKGTSVYWARVTVPKMSPADAQSLGYNPVEIRTYTLGTYTITVIRSTGASMTNGGTFNFTSQGVTQETFTVSVFNTADNTGFKSSEDPINNRRLGAFLEVTLSGSNFDKFIVSGLQGYRTTGSSNSWTRTVSDNELSRIKVGDTVIQPGSFSVSITVDSSPASVGNTAVLTIRLNVKADEQRFLQLGDKGPDATVAATFTINLQK
ncbi:MAG: hypothetical protein QW420_06405 [Candidatus Caldarchaeum sp.]